MISFNCGPYLRAFWGINHFSLLSRPCKSKARKRQNPPDPKFLGSLTFRCEALSSAAKDLKLPAADLAALQRAARRLRGPIECEFMEAKWQKEQMPDSSGALLGDLMAKWRAAGYFSEPLTAKRPREAFPGIDLISQVDESYGRDIGSEVPLCLLEDGRTVRSLGPKDWISAADSLEAHGAVVLREMITAEQVLRFRERLHLQCSALDLARSKDAVVPIREFSTPWLCLIKFLYVFMFLF